MLTSVSSARPPLRGARRLPWRETSRCVRSASPERARRREADGALVDVILCKLVRERRDEAFAGGVERIVLLPTSEIEYAVSQQFVGGNLIRDHFLGSWYGLADTVPQAVEKRPHGFGLRGDVLVNGLDVGLGHRDFKLTLTSIAPCTRNRQWRTTDYITGDT